MNDTSMFGFITDESGTTISGLITITEQNRFVVQVSENQWLVCVDGPSGPIYADTEEKATRWPTHRSAKRALSRLRKKCWKRFAGSKVYEVANGSSR